MVDLVTVGSLVAPYVAMAAQAVMDNVVADAYVVLKGRVSKLFQGETENLLKAPDSQAAQQALIDAINASNDEIKQELQTLTLHLAEALKKNPAEAGAVGIDVEDLQSDIVQLKKIRVVGGTGVRLKNVRTKNFTVDGVNVTGKK